MFLTSGSRSYVTLATVCLAVNTSTGWNPNTAAWLRGQRGKVKQDTIVARLREEQGVEIDRSWLSRIENGAPFSDELLAAFERLYGSAPPPFIAESLAAVTEAGLSELSIALLAELRADRALIREMLDLVREVGHRAEENSARIRALEVQSGLYVPPGSPAFEARPVPPQRGG